jgi:hypothetical protein
MEYVALFGVPRSGTSWIGQIFNSSPKVAYRYQPIFAYSFNGFIDTHSSSKDITQFYQKLLTTNDPFVCQLRNISGNETPQFAKQEITHLVWKEVRYLNIIKILIQRSATRVIGIVRHPCGVINSWVNAPREFKSSWDILEEWRFADKKNSGEHEFYGYERWLKATNLFLNLENNYPDQFKIIVYEDLINNLFPKIKLLFEYAGLEVTEQTEEFLFRSTSVTSNDPYGVYKKNKSGYEWKNQLNATIIENILKDKRYQELNEIFKWNI